MTNNRGKGFVSLTCFFLSSLYMCCCKCQTRLHNQNEAGPNLRNSRSSSHSSRCVPRTILKDAIPMPLRVSFKSPPFMRHLAAVSAFKVRHSSLNDKQQQEACTTKAILSPLHQSFVLGNLLTLPALTLHSNHMENFIPTI